MRIRWLLVAGRFELAVFDLSGRTWNTIATVWQPVGKGWVAVYSPVESYTFDTKVAAMSYIESRLLEEVESIYERRV
jgi:hypothetical protein